MYNYKRATDEEEGESPFFDLILSAETFYTADVTDKVRLIFLFPLNHLSFFLGY